MEKAFQHLKNNIKPSFVTTHRKLFVILFIVLFILFVSFTFLVRADLLRSFDFDTTVRLQDDVPVRLDDFFSFLSIIGRFEFTITFLLIILALHRKLAGFITIFLFGIAHIIEIIGKTILSQPGPPHMFLRTTHFSTEFPGLHIHTDASYPSGHSMRIVFIAILCCLLLYVTRRIPRPIKIFLYAFFAILVMLMLISRVSLGEHWTTDVVGGALLGMSFAFLSLLFL